MDHGRIIAEGSPRDLAAQLGRETLIEFVAPPGREPSQESLGPACKAVRRDGDLVVVETEDLVATMARLLDWSGTAESALAGMTVRQPNLEDVFLSMTGRRLRE
jgi:ABC-2 type transport system ATP-binding protein